MAALVLSGLREMQLFNHGKLSPWALTLFAGHSFWQPILHSPCST